MPVATVAATLAALIAVAGLTSGEPAPATAGAATFTPAQLLGANFLSLGAPAAAGGLLHLAAESTAPGSEAPPLGVISVAGDAGGYVGDVVLDVLIANVQRHPNAKVPGYEAVPLALLATESYNMSAHTGARGQQSLKLHATINESWFELQEYTNATATPAEQVGFQRVPAMPNGARLRIMRRGAFMWGGVYLDATAEWWGSGTNYGSSSPPGTIMWVPAPAGPLRIGVRIDPDYDKTYSIDLTALVVWGDGDRDGLSDVEEITLGTNPTTADSDGDGVDDWADVLPLDKTVGALPLALFANASGTKALTFKVAGTKASAATIVVNNTLNVGVAPGEMRLDRLAPGGDCVTVHGEARTLACVARGFIDSVPVPAWGRRAYVLPSSWDGVLVGASSLSFPAGVTVTQRVDLRAHIVSVLDRAKIASFSVLQVNSSPPGLFTATIESGHTLVVTSASGGQCGDGNVTVSVHLAGSAATERGALTVDVPVRKRGAIGSELIQNGNFTGNITSTRFGPKIDGWRTNTWSGLFGLEKCPNGTPLAGPSCAIMEGFGAGKFGVYQTMLLDAGTYSLTATMASIDLESGQWSGTTSIYASFTGDARPDFPQLASGPGSTHDLLAGSSGWRNLNATFSTPQATNATLYFFIWGSGRFFLQDVSLTQLKCDTAVEDSLSISMADIAPLVYNTPLTFEDTLLCGYCNDTSQLAFNETELCNKCAATNLTAMEPNKQATADKLLTDWTENTFFAPDTAEWALNANGTASLFAGAFVSTSAISADAPADWSSWSYLQIEVFNPSSDAQPFSVELRDTATVDYWTRVNWDSVVAPGLSTFRMPIDVYVGEKSEVKVRRRIDLSKITRLAIANGGLVNVSLGAVKLLPQAPFQHDFKKLLKIDVQPRTGPVLTSFKGMYPDTMDEERRGYGIQNTSTFGAAAQDREHPDDLLRDWVSFMAGGINFHLPPGQYGVWFVIEDAGYWEYYQNYKQRAVAVSGGASSNQTMSLSEFWSDYYAHADEEDLPGQSSWHRYIKPRYLDRAQFLIATVAAGEPLAVQLDSPDRFACTLSALLIWPMELNASATSFLQELEGRLLQQYNMNYMQSLPSARGTQLTKPATPDLKDRLVFFSPHITTVVEANSNPFPGEVIGIDGLNATVPAQGEASVFVCFVDAGKGADMTALPALQEASVTGLPTGLDASISVVRYKQRRLTMDGAVWANKPRLLIEQWADGPNPLPLESNVTRCLWVEITGPKTVAPKPAVHLAAVQLSFGGANKVSIKLTVTELAVTLPPASPLWVGYMGMLPLYPDAVWPDVRFKQLAELEPALQGMHRLGFSAATGGAGGPQVANESLADQAFTLHKQIFGSNIPVNSYMGSAVVGLNVRDGRAAGYGAQVLAALTNISQHAVTADWPDFFQTCGDEPQGDAVDASLAVGQAFADARATLSAAEQAKIGRTSVFTSVLNISTDKTASLLSKNSSIDLIVINEHTAAAVHELRANGHEWMLYNGGSRFRVGFYLAMASHGYGCHGLYDFAYSSVHADPYYALDSREDDLCAAFTSPTPGKLVVLLETMQVLREGLNDLRYTNLLRALVMDARSPRVSQRLAAEAALDRAEAVLGEIDGIPLGSDNAEWNATHILRVRTEVEASVATLAQTTTLN